MLYSTDLAVPPPALASPDPAIDILSRPTSTLPTERLPEPAIPPSKLSPATLVDADVARPGEFSTPQRRDRHGQCDLAALAPAEVIFFLGRMTSAPSSTTTSRLSIAF